MSFEKPDKAWKLLAVLSAAALLLLPLSFAEMQKGRPVYLEGRAISVAQPIAISAAANGTQPAYYPAGTLLTRNATKTERELTFNEKVKLYRDVIGTGSERQFDLRKVERLAELRKADRERFELVAAAVKKAEQKDRAELVEELALMDRSFVAKLATAKGTFFAGQVKEYLEAVKEKRKAGRVLAGERDRIREVFLGTITQEEFIERIWERI